MRIEAPGLKRKVPTERPESLRRWRVLAGTPRAAALLSRSPKKAAYETDESPRLCPLLLLPPPGSPPPLEGKSGSRPKPVASRGGGLFLFLLSSVTVCRRGIGAIGFGVGGGLGRIGMIELLLPSMGGIFGAGNRRYPRGGTDGGGSMSGERRPSRC